MPMTGNEGNMSETAETLKSALWELMQATGKRAKEARLQEATKALDDLLAEHRAEVEAVQAERDEVLCESTAHNAAATQYEKDIRDLRARCEMVEKRWAEASAERSALRDAVASARDAVLEEAAGVAHVEAMECRRLKRSAEDIGATHARHCWQAVEASAEGVERTIRALKSQLARRFVDAEKVREAMLAIADMDDPDTRRLLTAIAARLNLDLDADAQS